MSAIDKFLEDHHNFCEAHCDLFVDNRSWNKDAACTCGRDAAVTEVEELKKERVALQKLLDMKDEKYFKFCETGSIDGSKLTTNITP